MKSKANPKRIGKYILFALLPTIVLVVLVESGVRVRYYFTTQETRFLYWGLPKNRVTQSRSGEGYALPPNTVVVRHDVPGGTRINRLGLRGKDFGPEPDPNTIRILALGGSSTWGAGNRDGETWPEQLEAKLTQLYSPRKFEVVNAGIIGGRAEDVRDLFLGHLKNYRFHIGVLYLGWNDLDTIFGISECLRKNIPEFVRILNAFSNRALSILILREKLSIWIGEGLTNLYDQNIEEERCSPKEGQISPEELEAVRKRALMGRDKRIALEQTGRGQKFLTGGMVRYVDVLRSLIEEGQSRGMKLLYVRQAHLPHARIRAKHMPFIGGLTEEAIRPLKVPSFDMQSYFNNGIYPLDDPKFCLSWRILRTCPD